MTPYCLVIRNGDSKWWVRFEFVTGGLTPYCSVIQNGDSIWQVRFIFEFDIVLFSYSKWRFKKGVRFEIINGGVTTYCSGIQKCELG